MEPRPYRDTSFRRLWAAPPSMREARRCIKFSWIGFLRLRLLAFSMDGQSAHKYPPCRFGGIPP